jgi:N-acetylglucosamine kinase-like BadF-type ATPase
MLGSALAVCDGKPGLACILGTGSNICYFNGKSVSETRHGLGYVLGDEGSGSYYGKKLLSRYLYGILPSELEKSFSETYGLSKEDIINKVYHEPNANVFLASFAKFLSEHSNHEFIKKLVRIGMTDFFETNVLSYTESSKVPVHFVGSVAWYFKEILNEVASQKNVKTGNIIQKPIIGLAEYFLKGGKIRS